MANIDSLMKRIDAEFESMEKRIEEVKSEQLHEYQERQKRLASFEKLLAELASVWNPRLNAIIRRFGDHVKVTPTLASTSRQAKLEFQSELAQIRLRLSASTDQDVRKLVLDYNLEILPILMQFQSHQQAEWPLDKIDKAAIANWIDDRLVDFVRTFLSLQENEYYLKDHMVEDPVAGIRFPKYAAGATCQRDGKTYYFIADETRREFEAKHTAAKA